MRQIIKGSEIVDGTGAPPFIGDVTIENGIIATVSSSIEPSAGDTLIDGRGRSLLPGFIDVHSHDDAAILRESSMEPKIRQGVTSVVLGNCGHGCAPSYKRSAFEAYSEPVLGRLPQAKWKTFTQYLNTLSKTPLRINAAALVPHGPLRLSFIDAGRPASLREIAEMVEGLSQALEAGACGLSLGLMYSPGSSAEKRELTELAKTLAFHKKLLVAHIRNEADGISESVEEIAELARETGVPIHISHLKVTSPKNFGRMAGILEQLESYRSEGIDVTVDLYPYEAGSTTVATLFPPYATDSGIEGLLRKLEKKSSRALIYRLLSERWKDGIENYLHSLGADKIRLAGFKSRRLKRFEGATLRDIASGLDLDYRSALMQVVIEEGGRLTAILFQSDIDGFYEAWKWDQAFIGSDGLPSDEGYVHPRLYGTFPKVFSSYVDRPGGVAFEEAVNRCTQRPAHRFGLQSVGAIIEGNRADLQLIDRKLYASRATYSDPRRYPSGIEEVWVNGMRSLSSEENNSGGLHRIQRVGATL